jgi:hypothetical protein
MIVAKLTPEQAKQLNGVEFATDSYFNPIEDNNGNWIISIEEIEQCDIEWVKELPLIKFEPIEIKILP